MPPAVRFDRYGDIDVMKVVDVKRPVPGPRQVLVLGRRPSPTSSRVLWGHPELSMG